MVPTLHFCIWLVRGKGRDQVLLGAHVCSIKREAHPPWPVLGDTLRQALPEPGLIVVVWIRTGFYSHLLLVRSRRYSVLLLSDGAMPIRWLARVAQEVARLIRQGVTLDSTPLLLLFLLSFDGSETHVEPVEIRQRGQQSGLRVWLLLPEVEVQDLLYDVLLLLLLWTGCLLHGDVLGRLLIEYVRHFV